MVELRGRAARCSGPPVAVLGVASLASGGCMHVGAPAGLSRCPLGVVGVVRHPDRKGSPVNNQTKPMRAFANLGAPCTGWEEVGTAQPPPGFGWWTFFAPGRRPITLANLNARADTAQELVHVLCLPCLACLPGVEGCFCVGGRLWAKWGLCY